VDFDLAVIGLGYVGLPLLQGADRAGLRCLGVDASDRVVDGLQNGTSHVDDLSDAEVAEIVARGAEFTTDPAMLSSASAIAICVPTPLDPDGKPDLAAVRSAAGAVADHLRPGTTVILESTTYPGTTEEVLRPILEASGLVAGVDFHLAFSPERIDPGNQIYGLSNTPKVVGGLTPACTEAAASLYGRFVDEVVRTKSPREAEMAKLLENTYRHVNIALVNEMAVFCHELEIDLWDAIAAASTKPFGFAAFYPGPGVGGHCIPIDPNYLSYRVRALGYPFRFVELAQEISGRMPNYVVARTQDLLNDQAKSVRGSKILLLGVAYKANISDARESPSVPLASLLLKLGADISYADSFVDGWAVEGQDIPRVIDVTTETLEGYDLCILLQAHDEFASLDLAASSANVFDTRNVLDGPNVTAL
jgi:nucleotide sugar dehydrogenase